jgi:endonuclease/exonuclease/phosphatase (EEP) superfamily protein YafD
MLAPRDNRQHRHEDQTLPQGVAMERPDQNQEHAELEAYEQPEHKRGQCDMHPVRPAAVRYGNAQPVGRGRQDLDAPWRFLGLVVKLAPCHDCAGC